MDNAFFLVNHFFHLCQHSARHDALFDKNCKSKISSAAIMQISRRIKYHFLMFNFSIISFLSTIKCTNDDQKKPKKTKQTRMVFACACTLTTKEFGNIDVKPSCLTSSHFQLSPSPHNQRSVCDCEAITVMSIIPCTQHLVSCFPCCIIIKDVAAGVGHVQVNVFSLRWYWYLVTLKQKRIQILLQSSNIYF